MIPRMLTDKQKQRRFKTSSDLSFHLKNFDKVIIGDESSFFHYDPGKNVGVCNGKQKIHQEQKNTNISHTVDCIRTNNELTLLLDLLLSCA